MMVQIYSSEEMEKLLKKGFNSDTAVISFYDNNAPIDYSGQICRLFQCVVKDIDFAVLNECGLTYSDYFSESDMLAEFVLSAVLDGCEIICQCESENISAGCAAAILEYYDKIGAAVFADYRYKPNKMIYNKLYNSLVRIGKHIFKNDYYSDIYENDKYYNYIEKSEAMQSKNNTEDALKQLEILNQLAASDFGDKSGQYAYVLCEVGNVYRHSGVYYNCISYYQNALEIFLELNDSHGIFRVQRWLIGIYEALNENNAAVELCRMVLNNQLEQRIRSERNIAVAKERLEKCLV